MELPTVLSLFTRDPDHPQGGGLTIHVPEKQREESFDIEPVRLGLATAAIHFDAGRIDHQALHAQGREIAVDPESIGARFVAAHHAGVGWKVELCFGRRDLIAKPAPLVAADRPASRPLPGTDAEAQSPLAPSVIHRHHERRARGFVHRLRCMCHGHRSWNLVATVERKPPQQPPRPTYGLVRRRVEPITSPAMTPSMKVDLIISGVTATIDAIGHPVAFPGSRFAWQWGSVAQATPNRATSDPQKCQARPA